MTDPKKTAGMIQKYNAENAMLCASMLMKTVVLEASAAAAVLPMAIPTDPIKKPWAIMIGENFVARSAASAPAVWQIVDLRAALSAESSERLRLHPY